MLVDTENAENTEPTPQSSLSTGRGIYIEAIKVAQKNIKREWKVVELYSLRVKENFREN